MMVSTTAGGRPLKSATSRPGTTHGGSIDLDAGAIWCGAPERGVPSSEECVRDGRRGRFLQVNHTPYTATSRFAWTSSQKDASSEAVSQKKQQTVC